MNEKQPVRLTVTGTEASGESIALTTTGMLWDGEEGWYLEYEETNPEDGQTMGTLVYCQGDRVTVSRTGALLSTLVFDMRDTFCGTYTLPIGSLKLRVLASQVEIKRRGAMGRIRLAYQMTISGPLSSDDEVTTRRLEIRFAPCRQ